MLIHNTVTNEYIKDQDVLHRHADALQSAGLLLDFFSPCAGLVVPRHADALPSAGLLLDYFAM